MYQPMKQQEQKAPLDIYGEDLVAKAEQGKLDPVIGRDEEIRRLTQVLSRRTKNNPVLIGEAGVGKTAVVEGLARRIVSGDVPSSLNCKLYSLDVGSLLAGASYRGQFEERVKDVLNQVKESNGKIILFIDEIHNILSAGKTEGSPDAANLLKPMLARGELRCIGATTLAEYREHMEKDAAFERRFQPVYVSEPNVPTTISILRGLKERYENHHGVRIHDNALVTAAKLADRYISNRRAPDKAIDLVDEACANTRVQLDSQPEVIDNLERRRLQLEIEHTALSKEKDKVSKERAKKVLEEMDKLDAELTPLKKQHDKARKKLGELTELQRKLEKMNIKLDDAERRRDAATAADIRYNVLPELRNSINRTEQELRESQKERLVSEEVSADQICDVVSRWTGIPVKKLTASGSEKLLQLKSVLSRRVVGQDEAIDAVVDAITRSRAGFGHRGKPSSLMFLGPSGVGKTELCKAVAAELFDDERQIVRVDMSEYSEPHSVARLLGSPPGYVGHEEGGQLTEPIRRRPYSVVLFDEVEKAHPRVILALLQLLDDGRLTDGKGRVVDFQNTIVIMTSNVGSEIVFEETVDGQQRFGPSPPKRSRHEGDIITGSSLSSFARIQISTELKKHFRPEFLNRLDEIILFGALSRPHLNDIVRMNVKYIEERLADHHIKMEITDDAVKHIVQEVYDPSFGARPLRRFLERELVTQLSRLSVGGQLPPQSVVTIHMPKNGHLVLKVAAAPAGEDDVEML
eukprot:GCRY01003365.1.p1 GENE.GCRY01003365.1~~GCRY01003365.1.p1  ORF type:complete len:748 (-),score=225.25 GCRY01003365.1:429-2672(-)